MKLYDFGLWFRSYIDDGWSITIPLGASGFEIYYDHRWLGAQNRDLSLIIADRGPHVLVLENKILESGKIYSIGRRLTLHDLKIIQNPLYEGIE